MPLTVIHGQSVLLRYVFVVYYTQVSDELRKQMADIQAQLDQEIALRNRQRQQPEPADTVSVDRQCEKSNEQPRRPISPRFQPNYSTETEDVVSEVFSLFALR